MRRHSYLLLLLLGSVGTRVGGAATTQELKAQNLLFNQFDTVGYTRAAFLSGFDMREMGQKGAPEARAIANLPFALRVPFLTFVSALRSLSPTALGTLAPSYGTVAVGAKEFSPPQGIGMASSRTCYIGILQKGSQPDIHALFKAAKVEVIEGLRVWVWSIPPYEGHPKVTTFYASHVGRSYFVLTNDRDVFDNMVKQLTTWKGGPDGILGWTTFSAYDYWLYRPASGMIANGKALAFFADLAKSQSHIQIYVGGGAGKEGIQKEFPASGHIEYRRISPDTWQATVPLTEEQTTLSALLQLLGHFGYGIAI